ncbi:XdhC family protein [Peptoniphilus equinus]|uniref:XdhC family protein n=1 Tax=Peptoniphilus equinus TaxID=3016343 RepID=A0ABY7QUW7_9FIRM|nr:XdhC family protein [Peptoniphilus equinus]WBW50070.1 XdhC family protein [Peptoniphilus equinus]
MHSIFEQVVATLQRENLVLVTVVQSFGSTPRSEGAKMIVFEDGTIFESIGGGSLEFNAIETAKTCLERGTHAQHTFILAPNATEDIGMVCGGEATLNFLVLQTEDRPDFERALEAMASERLMMVQSAEGYGFSVGEVTWGTLTSARMAEVVVAFDRDKNFVYRDGVFVEGIERPGRVILFGAGHVARAAAPLLSYAGFDVVVCDDRADLITTVQFPTASARYLIDFEHIDATIAIQPEDYVVIVTRSHKYDELAEAHAMRRNPRYIGTMGSRKKRHAVNRRHMDNGFTPQELERITSPIGVAIAAQTPNELGISITAQLIHFRATGEIYR